MPAPGVHRPLLAALAVLAACGAGVPRSDLRSPVPERRAAAVASLATSQDEADLPALLVAQTDASPLVRKAAAGAFTARGGQRAVEALGALLLDPEPEVVAAAARGLGAVPQGAGPQGEALQKQARQRLVAAYGRAGPLGRAEIAQALAAIGTSLREAVEAEARHLWDRNLRALQAGSLPERCGAAEELGRSGRTEAVRRLLPFVDAQAGVEAPLASAAARGLGAAGDRQAREALEGLLDAEDVSLAEAVAAALGALGDPAAAGPLAGIGSDGPSRLALVAVHALAALPQAPEVGVALCQIAVRALDPTVAERAARLARAREADCPERPLVSRIGRRGADAVAALAALGALGLPPGRLGPAAERAAALLQSGGDASLRAAAARALGLAGWTAAGPALLRRGQALLQRLSEARLKWLAGPLPAAFAPGFEGPGPRLEAVLARGKAPPGAAGAPAARLPPEWVEDVAAAEREELAAVALALARLRAEGAAAFAAGLVRDPDEALRASAVEALGHLGGDIALKIAMGAVADPGPRVRHAAAAVLPRFGAAAVPALAAALRDAPETGADWRGALVHALAETGSPDAAAPLASLLEGPQAPAAAAALGRLGTREGARALVLLLERQGALGRVEAVEALGQLADPAAAAALAGEITNDRPEVRAAAARALGRVRSDRGASGLEALRSDYYGEVRRAAVEALARLPAGAPARR